MACAGWFRVPGPLGHVLPRRRFSRRGRRRPHRERCGALLQGFVHVRVWFPQFPGVVMMSDQELIIMCKPPEPTIIENKAAGFAGSL